MTSEQIIHGLNCPECGGALEVEEGRSIVDCPHCGSCFRVGGQKGVWRFQLRPTVAREQVLAAVRRFFHRWDLAPGLRTKAAVQESFLVYLPYWRAWMRVAAWLFGRKKVKNDTVPQEKVLTEDFVWTDAACDVGEFGLQEMSPRHGGRLEAFDRESLQHHALVLEPSESRTEALEQAEHAYVEKARKEADLSETSFERFQFLQQKLSLVYYPLWVVRYRYNERTYQVLVDERRVVSGRAPGNPLWQAVALIAAMVAATTLPVDLMMQSVRIWKIVVGQGIRFSFDLILLAIFTVVFCIGVASLITAVILAGFSVFRFGGERVIGGKQRHWDPTRASVPGCLWGAGWIVVVILSLAFGWRHEVIIPAFILATFTALGLGCWMMEGTPAPESPREDWLRLGQAQPVVESARPELVSLRCPNCQTPLHASENLAVYCCQGCGWGLELELAPAEPSSLVPGAVDRTATEGLRRIDIAFAAPQPVPRGQRPGNLPFWVFDAEVEIQQRKAVKTTFMGWETGPSPDRGDMWQHRRRFYVPAFGGRLKDLETWGVHLTREQPEYSPGKAIEFQGCVRTAEGARHLAELIFLRIESGKRDVLQDLEYSLSLTSPRLLVIPFREE
jgi:ribosomal protein L37AE/L43A